MYPYSSAVSGMNTGLIEDEFRFLPKFFVFLLGLVLVVGIAPSSGLLICTALAIYALKGPKETIQAFTLLAFLLLLGGAGVSMGRWLVLLAGFSRAMWDSFFLGASAPRILKPLLLLAVTVLVLSVLASYFPVISVFKVVSFTLGVSTICLGFYRTAHLREYWLSWLLTLGIFILVASLPLYGTSLGYGRNGVGFQGILSHPQTYGPVVAPITAFLTGLFLFRGDRSLPVLFGMILGWIGIYMSLSRTALLAALLGFFITLFIGFFKAQTWQPVIIRALSRGVTLFAACLVIVFAALQWALIQERVTEFLLKDQADMTVSESLQGARGDRIQRSMDNFRTAPFTGIGFGVPSDPTHLRLETGAFGLPVGASVEKGFMPSAVLEETGIAGAVLVILLLVALIRPVLKQGSISLFWMLATCLMINAGEMVFFSMGGMGFYFWILMAFCHIYAMSVPLLVLEEGQA